MQFKIKSKPFVGQKRVKRKFTLFPLKHNKTIYLLEFVYIVQEYQKFADKYLDTIYWHKWVDIHFTTKGEYKKHIKNG